MQLPNSSLYKFFVGQPPEVVSVADAQWRTPLPADRKWAGHADRTYADYFTAAQNYLEQDQMALPVKVMTLVTAESTAAAAITEIHVHLVKHGAFYHPALVTLFAGDCAIPFVLNVAVSEAGRTRLPAEVAYLEHLNQTFPENFVPHLYGWGAGRIEDGGTLPMFAGQWLSNYHELHLHIREEAQAPQWVVWDTDHGQWLLNESQTAAFFRQAMFILTYYFDPSTLSAIMEWHHAAGDFVVKQQNEHIDVRLITVRRYGPLFKIEKHEQGLETLLEALTVFWIKTSLWLRLDRLDGVGNLIWAEGDIVAPMWQGFIQGLEKMATLNNFPAEFTHGVMARMASYRPEDFFDMGLRIAATYPSDLPEALLIKTHLRRHAEKLTAAIRSEWEQGTTPY